MADRAKWLAAGARAAAGFVPAGNTVTVPVLDTNGGKVDGVLLANALHFVKDQSAAMERCRGYLEPAGKLLVVEYDITRGSMWVPYPVSFHALTRLVVAAGFQPPELLTTTPSRFRGQIYSAVAFLRRRERSSASLC